MSFVTRQAAGTAPDESPLARAIERGRPPPHLHGDETEHERASVARKHREWQDEPHEAAPEAQSCWLCARPLGRRVEWHHPIPKSRGGRGTVPVHPICHRTLHAYFSNTDLERHAEAGVPLASNPDLARFLKWIAGKPPDFHAPTRKVR